MHSHTLVPKCANQLHGGVWMISVAHKVCNSMAVTYLLQTVTPWRGGSSLWSGCFCFAFFVVFVVICSVSNRAF